MKIPAAVEETYEVLVDELRYATTAWQVLRACTEELGDLSGHGNPADSVARFMRHAVESDVTLAVCRLLDNHKDAATFKSLLTQLPPPVCEDIQKTLKTVSTEHKQVKWARDTSLAHIDKGPRRTIAKEGFKEPAELFALNGVPKILDAVGQALAQIGTYYKCRPPRIDTSPALHAEVLAFLKRALECPAPCQPSAPQ
ncbi:MAG: hypothetical protein LAO05_13015 [Acidobacteriia bacterium]|nr:hypothetical protein [Terriglobia bacterium]